ncbi:uncharacterized protein MELLADRAFT_67097 [Melampsora larici-populina 98AG31]|uniref:Uncharacterized protein n=1 Tax=Melampsora larici-populina (strain 98AG31 / pathotype 3-4-7) TaxID=747676 RepID=F4S1S5_MELLP|nr:uncharacterized protein MELLADRAFT_67097 [Melampsora larici-populina 98AG31]EGG01427.1 hypothetical protein MELLADRAFT_67097 [Melampsora larici-populina 98AG31]
MFDFKKLPILWVYICFGSLISTSFLDERFLQDTDPSLFASPEGMIGLQTFPSISGQDASTSSGIFLNSNSRTKHQIQRDVIDNPVNPKAIIPDLNDPYIDESTSTSSELGQREDNLPNDGVNTPHAEAITVEDQEHTDSYSLSSNMMKDHRGKRKQIPTYLQEKRTKTSSGIEFQDVTTQKSLQRAPSIENEKLDRRIMYSVLKWQARLSLGKKYGLSEEIKSYFKTMKEYSISNISNQSKQTHYKKQVEIAFEKIKTDLVFRIFGIVNVSFRGAQFSPLIPLLLEDAWNFLQSYLDQEILWVDHAKLLELTLNKTKPNQHFLKPGQLMIYTLSLSKQTNMPSSLTLKVIRDWKRLSTYKQVISRISLDPASLSVDCARLYQERGEEKKIRARNPTHSNQLDTPPVSLIDTNTGGQTFALRKFSSFIKRSGNQIIGAQRSQAVANFFTDFSKMMWDSYQGNMRPIGQSIDAPTNKVGLSWAIVEGAMRAAQESITPSFIGLLGLMHPEKTSPMAWDDIYENGWEFLKSYFSTWHRYISETAHPIFFDPPKDAKDEIEWANVKETLHYLHRLSCDNAFPCRPIWYLVDLWYDSIRSDSNTMSSNLNVLPPHREKMKIKCIQLDDQ